MMMEKTLKFSKSITPKQQVQYVNVIDFLPTFLFPPLLVALQKCLLNVI